MAKEENFDERMMARCLQLAKSGMGQVAPNPMVGCVITYRNQIIGEGFHRQFGGPHAEVHAIQSVQNPDWLPESTLYVNLEPCSHHGKTPPCADLIIHHRIPEVHVAMADPNPRVAGSGIKRLREAGVKVRLGLFEKEARELNKRFVTFHTLNRPWVLLKWAQTLDGFIDTMRDDPRLEPPPWITNEESRRLVHKWRTEEQAILAGPGTLLRDNPRLTVRDWFGPNPLRIVFDPRGNLPPNLSVFDGEAPTIVYGPERGSLPKVEHVEMAGPIEELLPKVLADLARRNIASIMVEGGQRVLQILINRGLWDEARVFSGSKWFFKGIKAPDLSADPRWPFQNESPSGKNCLSPCKIESIGDTRLLHFLP